MTRPVILSELRKFLALCAMAALHYGCGTSDEGRAKLKPLYDGSEYFKLRDAMKTGEAPAVYWAWVAYAFHDWHAAERYARETLASERQQKDWTDAHWVREMIYARGGKYAAAFEEAQAMGETGKLEAAFMSVARHFPPPECGPRAFTRVPWTMNGHLITIPVLVNGNTAYYGIDTGSSHSFVTEAEAKQLGLKVYDVPHYQQGDLGQTADHPRLALMRDLSIGNLHLKNVLFAVTATNGSGDDSRPGHQGVLGLDTLLLLQTIRWGRDGFLEIGFPPGALDVNTANLCFDIWHLMTEGLFRRQPVAILVDTGVQVTGITETFARRFPDVMQTAKTLPVEIWGIVSHMKHNSKVLSELQLRISGYDVAVRTVPLFTRDVAIESWYDVSAGVNVWTQPNRVSLDFRAMRLSLE